MRHLLLNRNDSSRFSILFFLIGLCFICGYSCLSAMQADALFLSGNKRYASGEYQAALETYQSLIKNNQKNGPIYYNLGNTYFKLGKKGMALLHYERARQYLENDDDLNENILFLKETLNLNEKNTSRSWAESVSVYIQDKITVQICQFISYGIYLVIIVVLSIAIFNMKLRRRYIITLLTTVCCFIISLFFLKATYNIKKNRTDGIVITPMAVVRYSPSFSGAVALKLTEGTTVEVIRHYNDWKHIRLNKSQSGWVTDDMVEEI